MNRNHRLQEPTHVALDSNDSAALTSGRCSKSHCRSVTGRGIAGLDAVGKDRTDVPSPSSHVSGFQYGNNSDNGPAPGEGCHAR